MLGNLAFEGPVGSVVKDNVFKCSNCHHTLSVSGPDGCILCLPISDLPQHSHQRALDAVLAPTSVALKCYLCQGLTASCTHTIALLGGVLMTVLALSKPDGSCQVFDDSTVALCIKVPVATADKPKEFVLSAIIAHAGPNPWTGHYIAITAVALEGGKGAGVRRLNNKRKKWYNLFEDVLKASSYGGNCFEAYICVFVNPDHRVAPVPDLSTGLPSLFGKKQNKDNGEYGTRQQSTAPKSTKSIARSQTGTQQTAAVPASRNTGKKFGQLRAFGNLKARPINYPARSASVNSFAEHQSLLANICAALVILHNLFKTQQPPQNAVYRFEFDALCSGLVAQSEVNTSTKEELASRLDLLALASSTILGSAFVRYSAMHPDVKAKTLAELGVEGNAPHLDFGRMRDSIMTITPWNAVKQVAVDKPHLAYWHPALTLNAELREAVASCISRGFGYDQVTDVVLQFSAHPAFARAVVRAMHNSVSNVVTHAPVTAGLTVPLEPGLFQPKDYGRLGGDPNARTYGSAYQAVWAPFWTKYKERHLKAMFKEFASRQKVVCEYARSSKALHVIVLPFPS
ncbi:uncharacterized protein JCM10292_000344 [Rhodotorula paludigena]|uniref:uncharacterized protein n=1 Tax=Rhodotorula paludigena TaxID=86838 RepID=UPI003170B1D9